MVFSSITFLFYFLPAFLLSYWVLPWRNAVLLVASLLFYAWGEPQNLPLLLVCIAANYGFGRLIGHGQEAGGKGRMAFIVAIAFNLSCLAYYKYFNFAMATVRDLGAASGLKIETAEHVNLPLGISFFIFHAISYLVDVYRKKTAPEKNFTALFTYIIMFPQLVAGPIVRFSSVARQLHARRFSWMRIELGLRFFVLGLAQKTLLANTVALTADQIFSLPASDLHATTAWLGAICYALQIFFDFSGYSLMAIGLGLACGFAFPRNFNLPYAAQSVTEFWRKWHMSLSRWFRDYVYIPLGGNRGSNTRTAINLFTVFFLCGLWHGANWTFILWGLYHGLFLVLERAGFGGLIARLWRPLRHAYAMVVVLFGWVLFRSESTGQAASYMLTMLGFGYTGKTAVASVSFLSGSLVLALIFGCLLSTPLLRTAWQAFEKLFLNKFTENSEETASQSTTAALYKRAGIQVFSLLLFILCSISLASGAYNPFIYFRF